jgi:hypothetical protein
LETEKQPVTIALKNRWKIVLGCVLSAGGSAYKTYINEVAPVDPVITSVSEFV